MVGGQAVTNQENNYPQRTPAKVNQNKPCIIT